MSEYDDIDNDWGADPFEGDMDFDMDFDSPGSKKGFLQSAVSGFLDGIVERTIGSTDAKVNTLKRVLPATWAPAFRNVRDFNDRANEIFSELKQNSAQTVDDLQYLALRAAKAAGNKIPNKISGALVEFSQHDFSGWDQSTASADDTPKMEETTGDEIKALIDSEDANSILSRETIKSVGKQTLGMMAEVGGRTVAGMHAITQTNLRTNQLLEHLLDYQRRVQQRTDNLQLSVAARQLLTSSKYYKFMEASQHRLIEETKLIVKYSQQSDYEKTTNSQALKRNFRETVFNTVKSRFGGAADYFNDKFGKDARDDITGNLGELTGSLRMVAEMTEGMPINIGSMAGNAAAGLFLNNIPKLVGSAKGKEYLAKFKKQFPGLSKWAEDAYIRLGDLGNVANYATGNVEELVNTMAKHYQGQGFNDAAEMTYEEYVASLPQSKKPMPKAQWYVAKSARGMFNNASGKVLDELWVGGNTKYSLAQRTLRDSHEQAYWSRRSDRTLNEEIPRWFGLLHQSLEKIRTGNDETGVVSYDYVKNKFVTSQQKAASVTNAVFDHGQFSSQATNAMNFANSVDSAGLLSPEAKRKLAMQLAKDADRKLGFNPYNLLDLENEGHDKKTAEAIKRAVMATFDITDEHVEKFRDGDDATHSAMLTYMPSEKARRLLPEFADTARSLATFMPDITNALDIYKSTGHYDAMKNAGIITPDKDTGQDDISEEKFWNVLEEYMKDPNKKRTATPIPDAAPDKTRAMGGFAPSLNPLQDAINPIASRTIPQFTLKPKGEEEPVPVKLMGMEELLKSFDTLKDVSKTLELSTAGMDKMKTMDLTPLNNGMDLLVKDVGLLLALAQSRNDILTKIQEGVPKPKKVNKEEEQNMRSGTAQIMDKIKQFSFKDFYNKAVDTVLRNEPLILGGLLGGLAGVALHNPKAAALVAGGAVIATAYGKLHSLAKSRGPDDNEDLYEEGVDKPILEAWKLQRGDYYDASKGFLIKSWKDIKGSVKDTAENVVIGAQRLAGKLFTAENKEVFLSGLNKLREALMAAFKWFDPLGRITALKDKVATRFFQMDVYKEGSKTPTLIGKSFAGGAYYKIGPTGTAVMLNGWNEIDGPVYDRDGNLLITQEDYDRGLVTSMGVSINKLGKLSRKLTGWGLDALKFGKDKAVEYGAKAYDKTSKALKADYSPIVNSVDRIYHLLLKKWDMKHEDDDVPEAGPTTPQVPVDSHKGINPDAPAKVPDEVVKEREEADANPPEAKRKGFSALIKEKIDALHEDKSKPLRKNSLADQEVQKEKAKRDERDGAIIQIAKAFGYKEKKVEPKKAGLFGMLASMIGGTFGAITSISTFFMKALWSPIKLMGTFASMALKTIPLMATGITAIAKGLFTLFKTKSLTAAGTSILDTVMDRDPDMHPAEREKRRRDRAENRKKPGTKLKKAGLGIGLGMLASTVTDGMVNSGIIEEDGLADHVGGAISTAATVYGGYQLASGVAALAGVELGAVVATAAAGAGGALLTAAGWLGTGLLAAVSSPVVLGAAAVALVGYGLYKLFKAGQGTQAKLRLTQYGLSDVESDLAEKVVKAEGMLAKFVVIGNGRASLSKDAPIAEVFKLFLEDPNDKKQIAEVFTWFNGRFKPVYLTYMACMDAAKFADFEAYDTSKDQSVYTVAKQTHSALSSVAPYPYTIVAKIDPDTPIMAEKQTVIRINNYLETLKQYIDRKTDKEDLKAIALPASAVALKSEKARLEEVLDKGGDSLSDETKSQVKEKLSFIDKQLAGFDTTFKVAPQIANIYIKDLLPDDRAMSLLTAIRLATYGNDEDTTWRVEAVLKLERFCENLFVLSGDTVVFNGDVEKIYSFFKDAFRLGDGDGEEWAKWFRDRFSPVLSNYVKLLANYRKGNPGVVWKTLSATARYEIAQGLVQTQAYVGGMYVAPIWKVRASPFKGSVSADKTDKVDRMLKMLGEASTQATVRDPEKEAGKTNTKSWANTISPHKVGGGMTEKQANVQTADQYKTKKDLALGGQYGTNTSTGAGTGNLYGAGSNGVYRTPENQFGYKPLTGSGDTSHLDMTGVQKVDGGKDTGVKVPKKLAEQLMIREMLKQGFTDPRAIAEMLALTNYESDNYSRTVENLKYSDPTRLMKLFREVTSLDQARQLVAMGEVAIGNTVYGGGKGASLGNTAPGDGYKYRGRGFVQSTGKYNYAKLGQALGLDLVNKPELLSEDPNVMAAAAVQFYKDSKLLQGITVDGDFGKAATGINGGNPVPGMQDRYKLYLSYLDQLGKGELTGDDKDTPEGAGAATAATPGASGGGGAQSSNGPAIGSTVAPPPLGAASAGGPMSAGTSGGGMYSTPNSAPGADQYGGNAGMGGSGQPFVMSGAGSDNAGLRLKSAEATAGGDSHPGVKRLGQLIQANVSTFKQITAMNDAWHRNHKPKSKHAAGLALDFTLTDGARSSDQAVVIVKGLLQQAGLQPNEFLVLNEYKRMSAGATGGHVHAGFASAAAADKFNAAAGGNATNGQDTTAGGGPVQQKDLNAPPPQLGVETEPVSGGEAEGAGGNSGDVPSKPRLPGEAPPKGNPVNPRPNSPFNTNPGAGMGQPENSNQQRQSNNQANNNAQSAPASAPVDNGKIESLLADLLKAINEKGDAQTGGLGEVVKQLQEANQNLKSKETQKRVSV